MAKKIEQTSARVAGYASELLALFPRRVKGEVVVVSSAQWDKVRSVCASALTQARDKPKTR